MANINRNSQNVMGYNALSNTLDIGVDAPLQYGGDTNLENRIDALNYSPLAPVLTVNELAQYLQVSKATAYELVRQEGFPAFKVGKSIRVSTRSLDAWIQQQCVDMEEAAWQNAQTVKETSRKEKTARGKLG